MTAGRVMAGRLRASGLALVAATLLAASGCGGDAAGGERPRLTVSAAASLTEPLERYGAAFAPAQVRLSLGGSNELAAQIRQGARPDVYAAANTKLPQQLFREGLVERPTVFATNRLVLAVPAGSRVRSLADLERPATRLVVGSPSVPVGAYTREALGRLGPERSARVLANVRSEEPDVKGVVAKVAGGAADAGFVYRSDVVGAGARLRTIELPPDLRPRVEYGVALVRGPKRPRLARSFVEGLVSGRGQAALREAGLGPSPAG